MGREWPDDIPPLYEDKYRVKQLRDSEIPIVPDNLRREASTLAEKSVESVKRLIFPVHKLS